MKTIKRLHTHIRRFKIAKRCSTALIGVALAVVLNIRSASAQSQIQVDQSVVTQYGQSLTFTAHIVTPISFSHARLTIQVLNRTTPLIVPSALNNQSDIVQTVSVHALDLPPAATLTYFWEFEDQSGQIFRSDSSTVRYADNQVPWEWAAHEADSVTVFTMPQDQGIAQVTLEIAATARASAEKTIGTPLSSPVTIYVYPALAPLANSLRAHQRGVQDWVAAYAIPDQMTILISAIPGPDMLVNLKRDLPHEMMHLALYSLVRSHPNTLPGWLNEGLALNTSEESDPTLDDVLRRATSRRVMLSINTLCTSSFANIPAHDAALAYAQSASLVQYLGERYGPSQINALVTAYANGLSCDDGVRLALGISLSDLEIQWLRNLASTRTNSANQESTPIGYVAVWILSLLLALLFLAPQPSNSLRPLFDTKVSLPKVPGNDLTA